MNESYFSQLLESYISGKISGSERKEFFELLEQEEYRKVLEKNLLEEWTEDSYVETENTRASSMIEQHVLARIKDQKRAPVHSISFFRKYRMAVAAILCFLIAGITWLALHRLGKDRNEVVAIKKTDIIPGRDGAVLSLGNDKTIILDSAQDGRITDAIIKKGNKVLYSTAAAAAVEYNTLTTPKGRQFTLVLADGTQVWLNAASSITYPTAFTGTERKVIITGEAYFEVTHDTYKPFVVSHRDVIVQVLGTHFNINTYDDEEDIKVTLLEGSVNVLAVKTQKSKTIKPNEQAILKEKSSLIINHSPDIEKVIAWKNGYFNFNNTDLKTLLRQVARWYDVDIVYEGNFPADEFMGGFPRQENISDLLKILEATGKVNFRIEGRKIIATYNPHQKQQSVNPIKKPSRLASGRLIAWVNPI